MGSGGSSRDGVYIYIYIYGCIYWIFHVILFNFKEDIQQCRIYNNIATLHISFLSHVAICHRCILYMYVYMGCCLGIRVC